MLKNSLEKENMVNLLKSITVYILLLVFLLIIANCGVEDAKKIVMDTTPPDTSITSQPLNLTNSTSANFSFSTEDGSTFECQIDSGSYTTCTSPKEYTGLAEGSHTFNVRAIDTTNNTDQTPASYTWTIDTTAVEISITSKPSNPTNSTSATFSFTSTETATFECQIDSGGYTTCISPKEYIGLAEGSHTLDIKATDAAGNTNSTLASYTWTIDTTTPTGTISINNGATYTNSISVTLTLSCTDSSSGCSQMQFSNDNSTWSTAETYSTSKTWTLSTGDGTKTVYVKFKDNAGNWTTTTISDSITLDTTAPDTSITSQPLNLTNSTSANFSFTSTETATFECQIDSGGYAACTSPKNYTSLTEGLHTFEIKATDAAGNTNLTPASYTWTIDTILPTVSSISPEDVATGVALSTSKTIITATFSEVMDKSTITTSTFTLSDGTNTVTGTVTYSSTTATFTLSSNLTSGTTYTATITTDVKDTAGNKMASDKKWSFTTLGNLTWDAPTTNVDGTPVGLTGYKVYYGTSSGNYATSIVVGNVTTYGVKTLSIETTYYLAVAAYDTEGNESDYSNEVSIAIQ
jgi:hypothetical protein